MADFTFTLDDAELQRALRAAIAVLAQPQPLMEAIGQRLVTNAQLRFDTKTDPTGKPWAPLAEATKEIYTSQWFIAQNPAFNGGIPGSLLERTRLLRASLAYNAGTDYVEVGTSRATQGGKWQVGWLHETGTRRMPRRGFLVADPKTGALSPQDQQDVLDCVNDALLDAFGG
jgi:phage gpG-like protein